jgi:hypothetical protein
MFSLSIFDFDNTLFRSPEKPEDWPHKGWWGRLESLMPPFVPEKPMNGFNAEGQSWWNVELLKVLENEEFDGNQPHIVTGRMKRVFTERMNEILEDAGLIDLVTENRIHLSKGSTLDWKLSKFKEIIDERLDELADVGTGWETSQGELVVTIYEDRLEHIPYFVDLIEEYIEEGLISSHSEVVTVTI